MPSTSRDDIVAVALWMAGALISFSATAVALRELSGAMPLFDSLAARSAAGVIFTLAIATARRDSRALIPRRVPLHLARNVVHFTAIFSWSFGVTVLPLATVFALEFTAPAWVTLLAATVLGERLTPTRLAAVVLGVAGVLVILRPGAGILDPYAFLVLFAALGFGITTICTKALTRTEPTLAIMFWMSAIQLPMNLVAGRFFPGSITQPFTLHHALALCALCVGGFTSHWCLTNAYQRGDAIMVFPLDFLRIPLIALIGWYAYGETLDPLVFVGAALIVSGIVWNMRAEARAAGPAR